MWKTTNKSLGGRKERKKLWKKEKKLSKHTVKWSYSCGYSACVSNSPTSICPIQLYFVQTKSWMCVCFFTELILCSIVLCVCVFEWNIRIRLFALQLFSQFGIPRSQKNMRESIVSKLIQFGASTLKWALWHRHCSQCNGIEIWRSNQNEICVFAWSSNIKRQTNNDVCKHPSEYDHLDVCPSRMIEWFRWNESGNEETSLMAVVVHKRLNTFRMWSTRQNHGSF